MTNDRETAFALQLKDLCQRHEIAKFECVFSLAIENHSKTWDRVLNYLCPSENDGIESCTLQVLTKKTI